MIVRLAATLLIAVSAVPAQQITDDWEVSEDLFDAARSFQFEDFREAWDVVHDQGTGVPLDDRDIDVLRAGLRLPDDIALECAKRLVADYLDAWESRRVVELLLPIAFEPGSGVDFDVLRRILGSDDVPALFEAMAAREGKVWNDTVFLGKVHVYARAEHAPVACRYVLSSDERIRDAAASVLWANMQFADEHRELIARTVVELVGDETPDVDGPGLPAVLVGLLRADWLATGRPDVAKHLPTGFGLRWLQDERPSARDASLLLALAERMADEDDAAVRPVVMRSLAHLDDDASREVLETSSAAGDPFAAVALAHRGDRPARDRLVEMARSSEVAMALLLEWRPDDALALVRELCRRDPWALIALDDLSIASYSHRIRWDDEVTRRLSEVVLDAPIASPIVRLECALMFPGCATEAIADAALAVLEERDDRGVLVNLPLELGAVHPDIDEERLVAFLEAVRPRRFRALLREWLAQGERPGVSDFAWSVLSEIGDPEAGHVVVDHVRGRDLDHRLLGRFRSPCVREFLLDELREGNGDAAVALGMLAGIPEIVAFGLSDALDWTDAGTAEAFELASRGHILEGSGADAVIDIIDASRMCTGIGFLSDDRIRRRLQELRSKRCSGKYAWATAELALMGDDDARRQTWSAIRHGRYGWLSELQEIHLTGGIDTATMPWWIRELKTQCCRICMGATPIEYLEDWGSWFRGAPAGGMTPHEYFSRWWKRCHGRVTWSRFAHCFVPRPR